MNYRTIGLSLWVLALAGALYVYFFLPQALPHALASLRTWPRGWTYTIYLALGCIRGFTLVPATYLVVAGMLVLPPVPLFLLTLVGILVSSSAVYYFAESVGFDRFFERRYPAQVARLRAVMTRRELLIVTAWSFFPIAPTDVVCYVCGGLKINISKCLLGVALGEGAICAIYIFLGTHALQWLR